MSKKQPLVLMKRNKAETTSLIVAERFGKQHKNVLRDIEILKAKDKRNRLKFEPIKYIDKRNREQKLYEMDRRSFSILVMSFDGEKALQWKLDFYDAFERMEQWITTQLLMHSDSERQIIREDGKVYRRSETDTIKDFVDYCAGQGSRNAEKYYLALSKMVNNLMFKIPEDMPKPKNIRDILNKPQLLQISTADMAVENSIKEGMATGMYYKDVYKLTKERIQNFVNAMGGRLAIMSSQLELFEFTPPMSEPAYSRDARPYVST